MSQELLYTSSQKGLDPTKRGFCTVLATAGMPSNLSGQLERLSGYKHHFPAGSDEAHQNPVAFSHVTLRINGRVTSVLSRVSDYKLDYSGRSNKLAHHVVLDHSERCDAGPAWLLQQHDLMRTEWDGECKNVTHGPIIPMGDQRPALCRTWENVTGDAGHSGQIADAVQQSHKPIWIIYSLSQANQLLDLLNEVIALVPYDERWNTTFSTFFGQDSPDVSCKIRCVVENSDLARMAPSKGIVFSLTHPKSITNPTPAILAARGVESPAVSFEPNILPTSTESIHQIDSSPHVDSTPAPTVNKEQSPPPLPSTTQKRERATSREPIATAAIVSPRPVGPPPPREFQQKFKTSPNRRVIVLTSVVTAAVVTLIFSAGITAYVWLGSPSILALSQEETEKEKEAKTSNPHNAKREDQARDTTTAPEANRKQDHQAVTQAATSITDDETKSPSVDINIQTVEDEFAPATNPKQPNTDMANSNKAAAKAQASVSKTEQKPVTPEPSPRGDANLTTAEPDNEKEPDQSDMETSASEGSTQASTSENKNPAHVEAQSSQLFLSLDRLIWLGGKTDDHLSLRSFDFVFNTRFNSDSLERDLHQVDIYLQNPLKQQATLTDNKFNPVARSGLDSVRGLFAERGFKQPDTTSFFQPANKFQLGTTPDPSEDWRVTLSISKSNKDTEITALIRCINGGLESGVLPKPLVIYANELHELKRTITQLRLQWNNPKLPTDQLWGKALNEYCIATHGEFPQQRWDAYLAYYESFGEQNISNINSSKRWKPEEKIKKINEERKRINEGKKQITANITSIKQNVEAARKLRADMLAKNMETKFQFDANYLAFTFREKSRLKPLATINLGQTALVLIENQQ